MTRWRAGGIGVLAGALLLSGCGTPMLDPVPAPVTVELDELAGETVEVPLGSLLNITVGALDVRSITGVVDDPAVAEFVPGMDDGSAQFNPGVRPLAIGESGVTLSADDGGIDPVEFTLVVTP